jgi:PAS domain S-box-containing protein
MSQQDGRQDEEPVARPPGGPGPGMAPVSLTTRAWGIAATYFVFAALWIYFSDQALALLVKDPERLVRFSVWKGVAFVTVTSVLLLLIIRRAFGALAEGYAALQAASRQRDAHEREIERLTRLNAALSRINQAIVRLPERGELFTRVSRVLVEQGGFRTAWIGWHNPVTRQLEPAGSFGDGTEELSRIRIYTDDRPEGQGPAGTAFRSGRPRICNDLAEDPAVAPWRPVIQRLGLRSCAVFPIRERGQVAGLLNVYATEPGYFQQQEVEVLEQAADDISFALDNLAREQERQQAEAAARAERRFADAMIDSMPGILYLYDEAGRFLRWNRNFETVSGCSAAEMAHRHPLDFFAGEDRDLVAERIGTVFSQGESSVEAAFVARDGTSAPYWFTGRRVQFEGRNCLVGVGIDISLRKQAEQALRELNETLEQKVAQRTAETRAALVRAEAADRIKSAFLATMSHELRTPLNSIIGFTGILLQGLAGPLNAEQEKQLGMVRNSARHLLDLINDVLDISRIEAGQLEVRVEPFDLAESVQRVTGLVRPLAVAKGLFLAVESAPGDGPMVGDRRRVEQVLINLLNNAVKFTEKGGITLEVDAIPDHRSGPGAPPRPAVRFRVRDTGIGIRPADLETLFQPFRQVDTGLTRQHEGTGLGLAICRRLVELMEGHISVESEWQQGSCFTVVLPRVREPAP